MGWVVRLRPIVCTWDLFCINTLLFCRKSENSWLTVETNFPRGSYLEFPPFFCINMLLFHRKSEKLATNCQNMNFFHGWWPLNVQFSCINALLISKKSSNFTTTCRYLAETSSNFQKTITSHRQQKVSTHTIKNCSVFQQPPLP